MACRRSTSRSRSTPKQFALGKSCFPIPKQGSDETQAEQSIQLGQSADRLAAARSHSPSLVKHRLRRDHKFSEDFPLDLARKIRTRLGFRYKKLGGSGRSRSPRPHLKWSHVSLCAGQRRRKMFGCRISFSGPTCATGRQLSLGNHRTSKSSKWSASATSEALQLLVELRLARR